MDSRKQLKAQINANGLQIAEMVATMIIFLLQILQSIRILSFLVM